jgi:hypothetical protein
MKLHLFRYKVVSILLLTVVFTHVLVPNIIYYQCKKQQRLYRLDDPSFQIQHYGLLKKLQL